VERDRLQEVAERLRVLRARTWSSRMTPSRRSSQRCSPVSADRRSRPVAAEEAPDGIGRVLEVLAAGDELPALAVGGVEKNPPCSGRRSARRACPPAARARVNQRGSNVAS
jgi:hypothetical protein